MALTVAQLVARLTADTSNFYRGMAVANSAMLQTGGLISRVAAGAGLATLGMGIMSVRAAGNFEQSMNIVQAVSGATESQFKALQKEAIALGADFKLPNVSARDAADAMTELAKGGLSVDQILSATRGTLQLGLAANTGFANSAVVVARALKAFGLEGSASTRIADLFSAAANKSTADITDLALGFQMASAQFKAGDQTIQGLTTSLALMADAGIVGSDAGTSLKTMMNRLMAPTAKARDLMEELKFKVYDASGNMKSMPNIIGSLSTALQGMSKEQRNATLYTIFGSDAIRASRVMLDAGKKGWLDMEKSITKGGEAQALAEARTKGFNGALGAFGSAVETVAIRLGLALVPSLTSAVQAMAKWTNSLDVDKIIGFFSGIKDGVVWVYNLVAGSDTLQFALASLLGAFVTLYAVQKIIAIFTAIRVAWMLLNAAFIASPLGLIVLAIGALIGALVLAYMKIEAFRNVVNAAFEFLRSTVLPIMESIARAVIDNWDKIKSVVSTAVQAVVSVVRTYFGPLVGIIRSNWDQIMAVIRAATQSILIVVRGVLETIRGVINLVMGIIRGDWSRAWEGLKQIVSGTLGAAVSLIKNILANLIPAVLGLALSIGKSIVTGIVNGLVSLGAKVLSTIKDAASSAISTVAGWVVGVASAIGRAIMNGILDGLGGLAGALADKVKGAVGSALDSVGGFLGIGSPSTKTRDEIGKPMGEGIIVGFLLGMTDLPTKVSDAVRNSLEKGKAAVDSYRAKYSAAFASLANDALSAFDAATDAHVTKSEGILNRLVSEREKEDFKRRMGEARQALVEAKSELSKFAADPAQFGTTMAEQSEKGKQLYQDYVEAQRAVGDLEFEQRKATLERQAAEENLQYTSRRGLQRRHLEEELANLEAALIKHPEKHKFYQNKIIALLNSYGITYRSAGRVLGNAFADGLEETLGRIEAVAARMASLVARYLKLGSPAETGPLSDLDKWWSSFGSTLVSGLDLSPITRASAAMASMPYAGTGGGLSYTGSLASASAGGATQVTVYQVGGSLISERQLDERIREGVIEQGRLGRNVIA